MGKNAVVDIRNKTTRESETKLSEVLNRMPVGSVLEIICDADNGIADILSEKGIEYEMRSLGDTVILKMSVVEGLVKIFENIAKGEDDDVFTIDENTNVGELIEHYPDALDIIIKYGFSPLKNKILRKVMAPKITLLGAKEHIGMNGETFEKMLEELKLLEEQK